MIDKILKYKSERKQTRRPRKVHWWKSGGLEPLTWCNTPINALVRFENYDIETKRKLGSALCVKCDLAHTAVIRHCANRKNTSKKT